MHPIGVNGSWNGSRKKNIPHYFVNVLNGVQCFNRNDYSGTNILLGKKKKKEAIL